MRGFISGWQRKMGYIALLIALALMAIWFRSQLIADEISNRDSDCRFDRSHVGELVRLFDRIPERR